MSKKAAKLWFRVMDCGLITFSRVRVMATASISQDYWGDIKEDWGSGGRSPPEAEAFFVKLHIIFALKYNKQQLLSLSPTS